MIWRKERNAVSGDASAPECNRICGMEYYAHQRRFTLHSASSEAGAVPVPSRPVPTPISSDGDVLQWDQGLAVAGPLSPGEGRSSRFCLPAARGSHPRRNTMERPIISDFGDSL